jgi:hypothetical protein
MTQGTRVSGNLFHDNAQDLYVEVNHGPFMVDNNLFLSTVSLMDWSQGGAYAHNLMTGKIISRPEPGRETPYHAAHTTEISGLKSIKGGDNRFYNNIFVGKGEPSNAASTTAKPTPGKPQSDVGHGLWVYDNRELPLQASGNVYLNGARPYVNERNPLVLPAVVPTLEIAEKNGKNRILFNANADLGQAASALVTTATLGSTKIAGLPYENVDSTPLEIDMDYSGKRRDRLRPTPGPFEKPGNDPQPIEIW